MVRNKKHRFAFDRVGTYNVYKHWDAETAQYELEIIFKSLSSSVKLIVNRSSWQAHRSDSFEHVLRQSPLNTKETNSISNRFHVAVLKMW